MPRNTYFVQECTTCGRNLQVRVEYLGKRVVCQHCGAKFSAASPDTPGDKLTGSSLSLLERAEELLQTAEASGIGVSKKKTAEETASA